MPIAHSVFKQCSQCHFPPVTATHNRSL